MLVVREIEFDWLLVDTVRLHSSVYLGFYRATALALHREFEAKMLPQVDFDQG